MTFHHGVLIALTALAGGAVSPAQPSAGSLPGSTARVVANLANRPVQLTSYTGWQKETPIQTWSWDAAARRFVKTADVVAVSPDERWEATPLQRAGHAPTVRFTDRSTGKKTDVELPVPTQPAQQPGEPGGRYLHTLWPTWSPDGRHLLLNVFEAGSAPRSAGIVLVDVPGLKARFVRIEKALITVGGFQWTNDGEGVVVRWGKNGASSVRRYDLRGAVTRTWYVPGRPAGAGRGAFTPSGRRFVTACTSLEKAACVWDTATGKAVTRVKLGFSPMWGTVLGWYDERHLLASTEAGVGVVDLKGKVVEPLIKADKKHGFFPNFSARNQD